jgi:NADH:ubiquinone oxidoreductase subunit 5 (subunit L)/multisubunit Na+/H+ antiporter MnhA subunit
VQANKASIKAMILNRVGDFSLLVSLFLIFITYKAMDYATIVVLAPFFQTTTISFLNFKWDPLTAIGSFMFIGATGKSAQLILHSVDKNSTMVKALTQRIFSCRKTLDYLKACEVCV